MMRSTQGTVPEVLIWCLLHLNQPHLLENEMKLPSVPSPPTTAAAATLTFPKVP